MLVSVAEPQTLTLPQTDTVAVLLPHADTLPDRDAEGETEGLRDTLGDRDDVGEVDELRDPLIEPVAVRAALPPVAEPLGDLLLHTDALLERVALGEPEELRDALSDGELLLAAEPPVGEPDGEPDRDAAVLPRVVPLTVGDLEKVAHDDTEGDALVLRDADPDRDCDTVLERLSMLRVLLGVGVALDERESDGLDEELRDGLAEVDTVAEELSEGDAPEESDSEEHELALGEAPDEAVGVCVSDGLSVALRDLLVVTDALDERDGEASPEALRAELTVADLAPDAELLTAPGDGEGEDDAEGENESSVHAIPRNLLFRLSATYTLPPLSMARPTGELKLAAVPRPSATPLSVPPTPPPAAVETLPPGVMTLTLLVPYSAVSTDSTVNPEAFTAIPCNSENNAALPKPSRDPDNEPVEPPPASVVTTLVDMSTCRTRFASATYIIEPLTAIADGDLKRAVVPTPFVRPLLRPLLPPPTSVSVDPLAVETTRIL